MLLFFFFSSRRRHTRWNCDWSSDVCSSDLNSGLWVLSRLCRDGAARVDPDGTVRPTTGTPTARDDGAPGLVDLTLRSEERRVGKSVDLGGRRIKKKEETRVSSEKSDKIRKS